MCGFVSVIMATLYSTLAGKYFQRVCTSSQLPVSLRRLLRREYSNSPTPG